MYASGNECLKESNDFKDPFCNSHDNENADEGAGHQEEGALELPFSEKEADDAPWKDAKTPDGKSRKQDQTHVSQAHYPFQNRPFIHAAQKMIWFILQPSNREKTPARMFQNDAINGDLNIVVSQGKGKVEEDRHLVEDGEKHRERSSQGEVDHGKEEN